MPRSDPRSSCVRSMGRPSAIRSWPSRSSRPARPRSRTSRRRRSRRRGSGTSRSPPTCRARRRAARSTSARSTLARTAAIGAPAPTAHTPTLTDVGGVARAITTDPAPDLRLSSTSTTDALAAGRPFVLVIDSTKFRVSPACGRAVVMARYLLDRWPDVAFIHLEPYRYSVVTDTPSLDGSLVDPTLTDPAAAWGIGGEPWGARVDALGLRGRRPWDRPGGVPGGHGQRRRRRHRLA